MKFEQKDNLSFSCQENKLKAGMNSVSVHTTAQTDDRGFRRCVASNQLVAISKTFKMLVLAQKQQRQGHL